jgi:hypothetical protein
VVVSDARLTRVFVDGGARYDETGRHMTERDVPIEITVAEEADERPPVENDSRLDVAVQGRLYPTTRLEAAGYAAWWVNAEDNPDLADPVTTEWVAAPTRFLAAATLRELWERPGSFERVVAPGD